MDLYLLTCLLIYYVSMLDLDDPPKNKSRKIVFKPACLLSKREKLVIVGQIIGRSKKINADDIYDCMLSLNDLGMLITVSRLAIKLSCSARTIYRHMPTELKKEKELLNQQL